MEDYGFTQDLIFTTGIAFVGCLFLLTYFLPRRWALGVALFKVAVPFLYFGLWRHHFALFDDMTYMREGANLVSMKVGPIEALTTQAGFKAMAFQVGTLEILYPWINLASFTVLGMHYYVPVFSNVVLTCLCGLMAYKVILNVGVKRQYAHWYILFFLLHWDLVTWSSLMNLKDVWALLVTLFFFYGFQLLFQMASATVKQKIIGGLFMLLAIALSAFLRLYLAFMLLVSCGIWSVIYDRGPRRYVCGFLTICAFVLYFHGPIALAQKYTTSPAGIVLGSLHFYTTPQPWNVEDDYAFLELASLLHWLFFIPTVWGAYHLQKRLPYTRIYIVYALFLVFYYGLYDTINLGGPRHRIQMLGALSMFQFEFLWFFAKPRLAEWKESVRPKLRLQQRPGT